MSRRTDLPIEASLGALTRALRGHGTAVLVAEPGAGKTTVVPLVLLDEPWCTGRIVVVEPRRVAARAAATQLASQLGEQPGATVGWRMRGDTKVGRATRIEVITDGVFTRLLQHDPSLDGISCLVLDEFHERSLDVDLGLALALDVRRALRPELRILVMSATIDAAAVARLLDGAPVVEAKGRTFPVATRWVGPATPVLAPDAVAEVTRRALAETTGDVLVFLPGAREIRGTARALGTPAATDVHALHGSLSPVEQDRVLDAAAPGRRKVILSTNVAETSLTIEGVTAVVDSGWVRRSINDPRRAMSGLVTVRVSRASADQRRGRAGRVGPGVGYRLWAEHEHALLDHHDPPEITLADLVPLALELARWGDPHGAQLSWLDPPPARALDPARATLQSLDLVDAEGRLTPHGRTVAELPLQPRLAHALCRTREIDPGLAALACSVAALLGERDIGDDRRDADLAHRIDALGGRGRSGAPAAVAARVRDEAARLRLLLDLPSDVAPASIDALGRVVALAYPDRIARRRPASARYLLANGAGGVLDARDNLGTSEWLAIADLEVRPDGGDAPILLAAPITERDAETLGGVRTEIVREWDRRTRDVRVARERRIGAIVLASSPVDDRDAAQDALLAGVRAEGLALLPRLDEATPLRARLAFCRRHLGADWPAVDDDALLGRLDDWLRPALVRIDARRARDLGRVDVAGAVTHLVAWSLTTRLEELAPTHVTTPNGRRRAVDYTGDDPVVSVRLQDAFGWHATPRLAGGRVPIVISLLSPADRPVQITRDLAGFWAGSYAQVRAEMRGRYPKHRWPEDPTSGSG